MGILGKLFDFNRDGKLDTLEAAAEFSFIMSTLDELENEEDNNDFEDDEEDEW